MTGQTKTPKIVFMGTPLFAVSSLEALLRSEFSVVGVVTQPDRPRGRGKKVSPSPIKQAAQSHHLPLLQPVGMKQSNFLTSLQEWEPDLIVVVAFGRILPERILSLPPWKCINVHASLLPKFRGAAPIQWALIQGESVTGITTMLMDKGMDTGPILLQQSVVIQPEETAGELSDRLAHIGGELLVTTLREWFSHRLAPQPQDESQATLAPPLKKEHGMIQWHQTTMRILNNMRGMSPWPGAYTFLGEQRMRIWKALPHALPPNHKVKTVPPGTIVAIEPHYMLVATGDGAIAISEVQPANRNRLPMAQFLSGHAISPGTVLTSSPGPVERT